MECHVLQNLAANWPEIFFAEARHGEKKIPKKQQFAPENRPSQKYMFILEPSILGCKPLVSGMVEFLEKSKTSFHWNLRGPP